MAVLNIDEEILDVVANVGIVFRPVARMHACDKKLKNEKTTGVES